MRLALASTLLCALAGAAVAEPVVYGLDPTHSFVNFELLHFGTSTIRGRFGPIEGQVNLDRVAGRGRLDIAVATASVSTGWRPFDARIREPDLLDSDAFPQARFVAAEFRFEGDLLVAVRGDLTLRGVERPLLLRAKHFACEWRAILAVEVCGGDFEGEILRSEFGAAFGVPFVADRVRLLVQVEAVRP